METMQIIFVLSNSTSIVGWKGIVVFWNLRQKFSKPKIMFYEQRNKVKLLLIEG